VKERGEKWWKHQVLFQCFIMFHWFKGKSTRKPETVFFYHEYGGLLQTLPWTNPVNVCIGLMMHSVSMKVYSVLVNEDSWWFIRGDAG
jgi:hypothetical protein